MFGGIVREDEWGGVSLDFPPCFGLTKWQNLPWNILYDINLDGLEKIKIFEV